jgi:hypothetical protein
MATRDKIETGIREDKSIKEHTKRTGVQSSGVPKMHRRGPEVWSCVGRDY